MKKNRAVNPFMTAGLLMELLYLCSDHLVILQSLLGEHLGGFFQGVWQGLSIGLLLLGLLFVTPKGKALLAKIKARKNREEK